MTFDFIAATRIDFEEDLRLVLAGHLSRAFESIGESDEETASTVEELADYISITNRRGRGYGYEDGDHIGQHIIVGFTLELPDDMLDDPALLIETFMEELRGEDEFYHVLKFADALLQRELENRAAELFALEMKLRRALSFMYLDAYRAGGNPYDLLADETEKPMKSEAPKEDEMKSKGENQFFHLTFGQYRNLNNRPRPDVQGLVRMVRDGSTYEHFRYALTSAPIGFSMDADLLAALKDKMDAIERMRNCVAHNRQPGKRLRGDYQNALGQVNDLLDKYLVRVQLFGEDWHEEAIAYERGQGRATELDAAHDDGEEQNPKPGLFTRLRNALGF